MVVGEQNMLMLFSDAAFFLLPQYGFICERSDCTLRTTTYTVSISQTLPHYRLMTSEKDIFSVAISITCINVHVIICEHFNRRNDILYMRLQVLYVQRQPHKSLDHMCALSKAVPHNCLHVAGTVDDTNS